jgi:SAM-dependent methyltransferase
MDDFYDRLAPFYHLIYADWDASIARQAAQLDAVIRERLRDGARRVLDVACGIGTQSLGLAALGYEVTASDLSPGAVRRAREEAARRELRIDFGVGDMREAHDLHPREFDVVLCADNALPHLLSDDDILAALRQFHACTRPGGLCLVSARDYETMDRGPASAVQLYAAHEGDGVRHLVLQHRAFAGDAYDLTFYVVEDRDGDTATTHVLRSRYYAVPLFRLAELMRAAGFDPVERLDGAYFQPLLVGRRRGS